MRDPLRPTVERERQDFSPSQFGKVDAAEVDSMSYFELMRAWQDTLADEEQADPWSHDAVEWSETLPMSA